MSDEKSRQRLGRGLASLIGGAAGTASGIPSPGGFGSSRAFPVPKIGLATKDGEPAVAPAPDRTVPLDRIHPNPNNPRRHFDEAELAELAASLKTHGLVQPLLVRSRPGEAGSFEIVAGERRWRAARIAGLAAVPVVLREIDDRQALEIAIIENVQRADLNAVEEALGFQMLIDEHGYTQGDLGDILGKSRSHVANTLRLLKLPEAVREMVIAGMISAGHARAAVTQDDPLAFARHVAEAGLSVRQAEELARAGGIRSAGEPDAPAAPSNPKRAAPSRTEEQERLVRRFSDALGLAVDIKLKKNQSGGLRIDFASREELDALLALIEEARRRTPDADGPRIRSV
ncbi:ParB/RepB/Spo0J family partition protein [Antarcticirhabdus aurantiaca]|uniref:ParB/RepB/Spo0J family partition protein n=1 Tax=Antarcticirhabdus aurantiaca TaxID=2606717 RepID=A0ACD4NPD0_9HYPH|nr:ParB/RepB/Spo0J family partition protein [Antarcticirhabdus aurantiaca]WAJ28639.1 ParB/RepB/Spo0J family partition protein [Jeongeuplla avenae]